MKIPSLKKAWRGEEPFWSVFWVWVFGVNALWLCILIDSFLTKIGFGEYVINLIDCCGKDLSIVLVFFMFLVYCPCSLYFVSKADKKDAFGRLLVVILWILYITIFLFFLYLMLWVYVDASGGR